MIIYFGADHRGYDLKNKIKIFVKDLGYEIYDVGSEFFTEDDDYADYAEVVADKVSINQEGSRGILICGSGTGMSIVANKFFGNRATVAISADQIYEARRDDNINIICLAASYTTEDEAQKIVKTFLDTKYDGEERHQRRLDKLSALEEKNFNPRS